MTSHNKKLNNLFIYWIYTSLILVFCIIIVGGLTRLTNSGLSITEWELFTGILPPLNDKSWLHYFELYKKIPQYQLMNFNMTLDDFKIIFYWEYFHRILARFIGLFFLIPLLYFYFTKKIEKFYINKSYLIFSLIILQGFVGWFMVKSGLVNDVTVSHYRLALHLIIAFIIITIIFWMILNIEENSYKKFFKLTNRNLPFIILITLILLQVVLGAFVSGLDAGNIYQTWPMMGSSYFPNDIAIEKVKNYFNFEHHSLIQFYHRNFAYLIMFYILTLSFYIYKKKINKLYKPIILLLLILFTQIILGIFTLLSGLNIYLASAHQICSVILVFSSINLYFFNVK
jgi:cytochrome c oxidase assembly protein subunit 15